MRPCFVWLLILGACGSTICSLQRVNSLGWFSGPPSAILIHAIPASPALNPCGMCLSAYMEMPELPRNTTNVLPFLYLPALKRISAAIENPPVFEWPAKHPPFSPLTSLDIGILREGMLGPIISIFKALRRRWCWSYFEDDSDRRGDRTFNLGQMIDDLTPAKDTLVEITIPAQLGSKYGEMGTEPPLTLLGSFKALVRFGALKRLEAPVWFLTATFSPMDAKPLNNVLSENLEFLTTRDDICALDETYWREDNMFDVVRSWTESGGSSMIHAISAGGCLLTATKELSWK